MSKESTAQVVNKILENAEHRPWKLTAAIYSKLPLVYMRQLNLSNEAATNKTREVVKSLGPLNDDSDIEQIKEKLLQLIEL